MKHIVWLNHACQWRYITDITGFLFIGTHCIYIKKKKRVEWRARMIVNAKLRQKGRCFSFLQMHHANIKLYLRNKSLNGKLHSWQNNNSICGCPYDCTFVNPNPCWGPVSVIGWYGNVCHQTFVPFCLIVWFFSPIVESVFRRAVWVGIIIPFII